MILNAMIIDALVIILGYLLGSISTAIIVCKLLSLPDPRTQGSKNPGATNVLRIGNKKAAAITLLGDFLKGLLPVLLAVAIGASEYGVAGAGLGAFLGHLFPVFFAFQGGKGVATAFGVILALSPVTAATALLTWLISAVTVRISSVSSLAAAILSPLYAWWLGLSAIYITTLLIIVAFLIWRHSDNIDRLLNGTEKRIGNRKPVE